VIKILILSGLAVLAVGCLLFWPSGVYSSFGGFCGSMFVVGAGLSTLETGADNFLAICGPPRYSEIRLNLAQGIQGVGSFVAPLLASRVFFSNTVDTKQGLQNVQWVYLGVAGFVAVLIVLFFFAPMPEVTDADMHAQEGEIDAEDVGPFKKQYNLFLGVWSQFCYVGAQVAVANYFINFCKESGYSAATSCKYSLVPHPLQDLIKTANLLAVAQGVYAANRFIGSAIMMSPKIKPRWMLGGYLGGCFIFCLAATLTHGHTSVALLILVLCCESVRCSRLPLTKRLTNIFSQQICFATIFTLSLRGLGRHTKLGGSMLVAAISGGAAIPPMTGAVATATGNFHTAMAIPTAFFVLSWIYPLYANFLNAKSLDGHRATALNVDRSQVTGDRKVEEAFEGDEKRMEAETIEEKREGIPPVYTKQ
jgi:FHS family L-fucose permease-like MFS transporter